MKNKLAPPFRTAQFELEFGKGICRVAEIIELGLKHKLIRQNGSFYFVAEQQFHGNPALRQFLAVNDGAREELMGKIREVLFAAEDEKGQTNETSDTDSGEEIIAPDLTDEEPVAAVQAQV